MSSTATIIRDAIGDVTPSPHQDAFLRWVVEGKGSAILEAVAGSGKTFTLRLATKVIKAMDPQASINVCVFAKRNADEMKGTFPDGVFTGTIHSAWFGAYRRWHTGKVDVDYGKTWKLWDEMTAAMTKGDKDKAKGISNAYGTFVTKLVGLAKGEGVGYLVPDERSTWEQIISHHDMTLESELAEEAAAIKLAQRLLARSVERADLIDGDDMLYLPLINNVATYQNDWVFVDEAQDTNPVQRALLARMIKGGGRVVAVGDRHQAVFGFRGATADALDQIRESFAAVQYPLSVCYRCPRAVVQEAQSIVPHIESHPDAAEGEVVAGKALAEFKLDAADAILCRQNAPLINMAYQLIAQGVGCQVLGRDIGAGLVSLIKRLQAKGITQLETKLETWAERETAKAVAKKQESKVASIEDKVASLHTVIEHLGESERTIPRLILHIEHMFQSDKPTKNLLTLCTVHKAKGLEWDRVFLLRPDLMPSKWARQEWQQEQEKNLIYVAYTRAMKMLVILSDKTE